MIIRCNDNHKKRNIEIEGKKGKGRGVSEAVKDEVEIVDVA